MHGLQRDLVFAARTWRRRPAAGAFTIAALALGIGATSLAFAVLNAFFLRPLPVHEPARVVRIYTSTPGGLQHFTLSYPDFADIRDLDAVFDGAAAEQPVPFSLAHDGLAERIYGQLVAGGYFEMLGIRPAAGRFLTEYEENAIGESSVAVISYDLWQRRFGGDPHVTRRVVSVNGRPCAIVGVAPKDFRGLTPGVRPDMWRPAGRERSDNRGGRGFFVAARLRRDVSVEQARAAVDVLAHRLQREHPATNSGVRFPVLTEWESRMHPMVRGSALGLSGSVLAVGAAMLVLACANVAGVMLVAALARRKEIGVRLALGASRVRVVRQFLTEALLLSLVAGTLGTGLAWIGTLLLQSIELPTRIPIFFDFGIDPRGLAFSAAATIGAALLFGLAASLQGTRLDLVSMLKAGAGAGFRSSRLRGALVVLQVGLATTLLMAGGVFFRSLLNAQRIDVGFDPRGVVTASVDPGLHGYSRAAAARFWERLRARLAALPRVESVSFASTVPFELNITRAAIGPQGYEPPADVGWPSIDWAAVDTGYFNALRIPLVEGRDFAASDREGSPATVIVNQELARRFWPGESAVGRQLVTPSGDRFAVAGVVRDSRSLTLGEGPKPYIYFSFRQSGAAAATIVLRTAGELRAALADVRAAVASLDATLPIYNASTMDDHVRVALLPSMASTAAVGIVGAIAVLLIAVGLYAIVVQVVGSREQEIGVRYALGARRQDVLWLVLRQATWLVALGLGAGYAGGVAASRALQAVVYGVRPGDPLVTLVAPALLAVVCGLAGGIPALAVLRIDTASVLRRE